MTLQSITYLGVDLSNGPKPFTFVALDEQRQTLAWGGGSLADTLAFAAGLSGALVAVCAARQLNQRRLLDPQVRGNLQPEPEKGRWQDWRVAEYQLAQVGLAVARTPARMEHCPLWVRQGFQLYQGLETLGYQPFPQDEAPRQVLEVHADAGYRSLLGVAPFQPDSLEGRIQRQLALVVLDYPLADPMEVFEEITRFKLLRGVLETPGLHIGAELNALMAAHTAWTARQGANQLEWAGEPSEGLVYWPCPPPKRAALR